jgi:hypothetical protein
VAAKSVMQEKTRIYVHSSTQRVNAAATMACLVCAPTGKGKGKVGYITCPSKGTDSW